MSILNLRQEAPNGNPAKGRITKLLSIGGLVAAVALGATFASNISLNSGQNVEFGQGVAATTSCDDEIAVTPFSTFVNEVGAGSHKLTSIEVSGIDSSWDKCSGKTFILRAYGESGQLDLFRKQYINGDNPPIYLNYEDYDTIEIFNDNGVFTWVSEGTDGDDVITPPDQDIHNTSFTLSLSSALGFLRLPLASAQDVKRITIETRESVYQVGDSGPGGGIVFYKDLRGFECGPNNLRKCHYLEAAPNTWVGAGSDPQRSWSTGDNLTNSVSGADSSRIGSGFQNSVDIASQSGNVAVTSAAVLARGYDGGGRSDWYLPSKDELDELRNQLGGNGGFAIDNYWSSTEFSFDGAWNQNIASGEQGPNGKFDTRNVRPIRAF